MTLPENPTSWAVKAFRDERAGRYALYRQYLDGQHNLEYATARFRQAFGRLFEAFGYNRCATVVDAHADRLRVAGFGSDDTGQDDPIAQDAQALWDASQMDMHEGQLAAEAFGLGDAYLLVTVHPETGEPQLWPQSAEQVRVHWDDDRPNVIDLAAKMWRDEDERMRLNLYFADRIEKYRTTNRAHSIPTTEKSFEPYQPESDTEWPVRLPITDTVPVFHYPNNGRINSYGVSELRDVISLQDALNKSLMDQMVASEFAAAPQRAILGYDASDPESQLVLDGLVSGLTRMLAIPADADGNVPQLAEFSAADMKQYDLVAEKWDIRISRVSRVPVHYLTGETKAESGRAKRLNETPFVEKMQDRVREWESRHAEAVRYALRLQKKDIEPGKLRVNFEPVSPLSDEDQWDIAAQKASTGMPIIQILKEMGYEPTQIDEIIRLLQDERVSALMDAAREPMLAFDEFEAPTPDARRNDREDA